MSGGNAKRVCAFFSSGPHYRKVLQGLRARYPDAEVHAVVPPRYPEEAAAALATTVHRTEHDHYGPGDPAALWQLLRWLRGQRFDVFVVMFQSPKLVALARLSGAPERYCHTLDGRYAALRMPLFKQCLSLLSRRAEGRRTYARIHRIVRTRPVEGEDGNP